jgi:hypothetical protein
MRTKIILAGLATLLVLPWPVQGQTYPAETVVTAPEVLVRSGKSDHFYETIKLRQGDKVVVLYEVKDQPGWLAIKPPAGSFSWINGKYVKQIDGRLGYVDTEAGPVSVLPGSSLVDKEPSVESMKIERGTIVQIVDQPRSVGADTWLPIAPHPSEVRFLKADAVRMPSQQIAATTRPNWTLSNKTAPNDPLITEGEQALRAGNVELAKQKFKEAADRTSDPLAKAYANNRLVSLSQGSTMPGHPSQQGSNPLVVRPVNNATSTSLSPVGPPPTPGAPMTTSAPKWSAYGILRATPVQADGLQLYRLETAQGQPLAYVSTSAGKTLRDYVGRTICVYGPTVYRGDNALRMEYIVASHVAVAP